MNRGNLTTRELATSIGDCNPGGNQYYGDSEQSCNTKKSGSISIQIREINEQISMINKLISGIEELIFVPGQEKCCPIRDEAVDQYKTVSGELDSLHSRLIGSKMRLVNICEGLETQLDSNLRLV
jgi:hypothetical protein